MKKVFSILLVLVMCLCLCACGKSEAVKNVEALIAAIGEVTADSEEVIVVAEEAYNALEEGEKGKVQNHADLLNAREAFEELKYVGEWVFISDPFRNSFIFLEDNTWKHTEGGYGNWSLVENGLILEGDTNEWVYEEFNSVPRLVNIKDDRCTVLVKKEYASFAEYEINIDNWQEYFDYKRTYVPEYDAFGDMKSFSYVHWLALKPEYAERLVYARDEYQIAVEFSGTPSTAYGNLDTETGEFTADVIAADTHTQYDLMGTIYDWEMSLYYLDSIYDPENHKYVEPANTLYYEHGDIDEYGEVISGYLQNRDVGRIQGSILLYDYPVHQIMPAYGDALAQLGDSEVVVSPAVDIPEGAVTGIVVVNDLNVRVAPSMDADRVMLYKRGEKIDIIEQKDGWGKTKYGWVMMKYLKINE